MEPLWYVVGFAFAGVSFVFLTIGAAWLVSHRNRGDDHKGLPYESGIDTYGDTHGRFGLSFYIYALLFVAFDIEVVFIYLWAIVFRDLLLGGLREHADLRRDPAARARLRLAQGGADMALTARDAGEPDARGDATPDATQPALAGEPAGRRPGRPDRRPEHALAGGRSRRPTTAAATTDITHLARVRGERRSAAATTPAGAASSRSSRPRPTTSST